MTFRISVPLLTFALVASGCSLFESHEPRDAFSAFADALHKKDSTAAANDTDNADQATPVLKAMFEGMGTDATVDIKSTVGDGDNKASATLTYTWSFGPGHQFSYDTTATATKVGDDWRVHWAPTVLHTKLRPGVSFQFSQDKALLTPVVDRDGQPLLNWQTVGVISLSRDHLESAAALAGVLERFDNTITAESITNQFNGNQDDRETVIKLREQDLDQVNDDLTAIVGVNVAKQGQLLTVDPNLHSPAIAELPDVWRQAIDATAGWSVALVDKQDRPTDQLASAPPSDTKPVRTTLDTRLQMLAQQAVATDPRPTVLVAIAPSTGAILAAGARSYEGIDASEGMLRVARARDRALQRADPVLRQHAQNWAQALGALEQLVLALAHLLLALEHLFLARVRLFRIEWGRARHSSKYLRRKRYIEKTANLSGGGGTWLSA